MKISEWIERRKKADDELAQEKQELQIELEKLIPQALQLWQDKNFVIERLLNEGYARISYDEGMCIDKGVGDLVKAADRFVELAEEWRVLVYIRVRSDIREPLIAWGNKSIRVFFQAR